MRQVNSAYVFKRGYILYPSKNTLGRSSNFECKATIKVLHNNGTTTYVQVVSIKVNKSLDVTCNNLLIADLIIIQTCTYVCKYVYLYFEQVHSYLMYAFAYDVFKPPGTRAQNTTRLWWYVLLLVIQKTRTVRVRVPYLHCTGAARTQIVDSMDTNTLRDTQKILKKNFFSKFF